MLRAAGPAGAVVLPCNGVNTGLQLVCLVLCSGRPLARGSTVSAVIAQMNSELRGARARGAAPQTRI